MRGDKIKSVGDILGQLKKNSSLGQQLEQAQIWERWPELAGPRLAAYGKPHHIRNGVLTVEAENPVWMHRFAYHKWKIIRRINRLAQRELVHDIFVRLAEDD